MTMEDLIILGRGSNHVRVTRALRPLFLVDTILLQDVRRYTLVKYIIMGIYSNACKIYEVIIYESNTCKPK